MHAGQLDVLHNRRNESVGAVADGVRLTFHGMIQETVDENRTIRCHSNSSFHVANHSFFIVNDFHATATQHVGRTNHNRITDSVRCGKGFLHSGCHTGFRHRNLQLLHHSAEQISVFR